VRAKRRDTSQKERQMTEQPPIRLTEAEVALLVEALDSHEYWQLSESHERNDGHSTIEDGANEDVDAVRALMTKLASHGRRFD
jgi:hypothetical protein